MSRFILAALVAAATTAGPAAQSRTAVYVGSTPCGEDLRTLLAIPREANAELVEWELTLTQAVFRRYHLRYKFGPTRLNQPGLDATAPALERRGSWRQEPAAPQQPASGIVVLDNKLSLLKVGDTILHLLAPDRSLLVGT